MNYNTDLRAGADLEEMPEGSRSHRRVERGENFGTLRLKKNPGQGSRGFQRVPGVSNVSLTYISVKQEVFFYRGGVRNRP